VSEYKPRTSLQSDWSILQLVFSLIWMSLPVIIWLEVRAVRSTLDAVIAQGVTP
jgi:hypothetical protein